MATNENDDGEDDADADDADDGDGDDADVDDGDDPHRNHTGDAPTVEPSLGEARGDPLRCLKLSYVSLTKSL